MKVKVTKAFPGRPDREVLTRTVDVGEEIEGDLASVALAQGWAEPLDEDGPAPKALDEMTLDELKAYAADKQIDLGGAKKKEAVRSAIDAATAPKALDEMTLDELKAYAADKQIDISEAADEGAIRVAIASAEQK